MDSCSAHFPECHFSVPRAPVCVCNCDFCEKRKDGDIHLWAEVAEEVCKTAKEILPELATGTIAHDDFIKLLTTCNFCTDDGTVKWIRPQLVAFAANHYNKQDNPAACTCKETARMLAWCKQAK